MQERHGGGGGGGGRGGRGLTQSVEYSESIKTPLLGLMSSITMQPPV